jgi:hypothetical protein
MERETGYAKRFQENSERANRAWNRKKEKV